MYFIYLIPKKNSIKYSKLGKFWCHKWKMVETCIMFIQLIWNFKNSIIGYHHHFSLRIFLCLLKCFSFRYERKSTIRVIPCLETIRIGIQINDQTTKSASLLTIHSVKISVSDEQEESYHNLCFMIFFWISFITREFTFM